MFPSSLTTIATEVLKVLKPLIIQMSCLAANYIRLVTLGSFLV